MIPKSAVKTMTLRMLPFADAASDELPLGQLLRLSLFQISVGMAAVMLLGTLNRVMIVELSVPAFIVATMIAIPVLIAPFRALLGFKSDNYRSAIGWKRVPYLWFGSLWQFGGLAIMPMALLVLAGDSAIDAGIFGEIAAALAFLLTGLGMHMTQTAGLALAAGPGNRTDPRKSGLDALRHVSAGHGNFSSHHWHLAAGLLLTVACSSGARRGCVYHGFKCYCALEAGKNGTDEPGGAPSAKGKFSCCLGRFHRSSEGAPINIHDFRRYGCL
jgi:hypothetical protein